MATTQTTQVSGSRVAPSRRGLIALIAGLVVAAIVGAWVRLADL